MTREQVLEYARERFGTDPEYLFTDSPDTAVLRRRDNRKWYGIMMRVPCPKLGLNEPGEKWVLNVKCDPILIGSLLGEKGILPAWHMNKTHWVSLLVEDGADDERIRELMDLSHTLTGGGKHR